jgi:hypothetical protein
MQTLYIKFKNDPSQSSLDDIIQNSLEMISNSPIDTKGTGITTSIAKSFSWYWLLVDDDPNLRTNKIRIDTNFNEILADIDLIPKHFLSEEAKTIYINLIREFAKKIKNVYRL